MKTDSPFNCPECGHEDGMFRVRVYRVAIVKAVFTCASCGHIYEYPTVFEMRTENGKVVGWTELDRKTADTRHHVEVW